MYRCRAIDGGERRPLVAWLLLAGELIADRPAALVEDHPRNPIEERRAFAIAGPDTDHVDATVRPRSEEHTSELQSLMRISYAVFCLKNKNSIKRHLVPTPTGTK